MDAKKRDAVKRYIKQGKVPLVIRELNQWPLPLRLKQRLELVEAQFYGLREDKISGVLSQKEIRTLGEEVKAGLLELMEDITYHQRLLGNWITEDSFSKLQELIGREEELKQLETFIQNSKQNISLISGPGGIGKTSLLVGLGIYEPVRKKFDRIALVSSSGDLIKDLVIQLSQSELGFEYIQHQSLQQNYRNLKGVLKNSRGNNLLLVDGEFEVEVFGKFVLEFRELNWKVVVASRSNPGNIQQVLPLTPLSTTAQIELFHGFTSKQAVGAELDQLLKWTGGNTLLIALLGKVFDRSAFEGLAEFNQELKAQGVLSESFGLEFEFEDDGEFEITSLNKVVRQLYKINRLSIKEVLVLEFLMLAPQRLISLTEVQQVYSQLKEGVSNISVGLTMIRRDWRYYLSQQKWRKLYQSFQRFRRFGALLKKEVVFRNILMSLARKGWIEFGNSQVYIHDIVKKSVSNLLFGSALNHSFLIERLSLLGVIQIEWKFKDVALLAEYSESLLGKFEKTSPGMVVLLTTAGVLHEKVGNESESLALHFSALEHLKKLSPRSFPKVDEMESRIENNISAAYMINNNIKEASPHLMRARDIMKGLFKGGEDSFYLAQLDVNLAIHYRRTGKLDLAVEYHKAALKKWSNIREGLVFQRVITTYANLAGAYLHLDKVKKAKKVIGKAVHLYEKYEQREEITHYHHIKGLVYHNLAVTFLKKRNYDFAKEAIETSLEIRTHIFPKNHPHLSETLLTQKAIRLRNPNLVTLMDIPWYKLKKD